MVDREEQCIQLVIFLWSSTCLEQLLHSQGLLEEVGPEGLREYLGQNLKDPSLGSKSAVNNRGLRTSSFSLLELRFLA